MDNKFKVQGFKPWESRRETGDLKYGHSYHGAHYVENNVQKGRKKYALSLGNKAQCVGKRITLFSTVMLSQEGKNK